jgi:hypothetical protein
LCFYKEEASRGCKKRLQRFVTVAVELIAFSAAAESQEYNGKQSVVAEKNPEMLNCLG